MEKAEVLVGPKYIMKQKIGSGSFGQIYSGYDKETMLEVAIKLVTLPAYYGIGTNRTKISAAAARSKGLQKAARRK